MAKRFLRHARAKSDYEAPGARSAEVQAAAATDPDPAKRAPGRKDTRSWCRGKPGRSHVPEIVVVQGSYWTSVPGGGCGWAPYWSVRQHAWHGVTWGCRHEERCAGCGKVLRMTGQISLAECPAYPGTAQQKLEAEAESVAAQLRRDEWNHRRVITGRQGYRRKRQEVP